MKKTVLIIIILSIGLFANAQVKKETQPTVQEKKETKFSDLVQVMEDNDKILKIQSFIKNGMS